MFIRQAHLNTRKGRASTRPSASPYAQLQERHLRSSRAKSGPTTGGGYLSEVRARPRKADDDCGAESYARSGRLGHVSPPCVIVPAVTALLPARTVRRASSSPTSSMSSRRTARQTRDVRVTRWPEFPEFLGMARECANQFDFLGTSRHTHGSAVQRSPAWAGP